MKQLRIIIVLYVTVLFLNSCVSLKNEKSELFSFSKSKCFGKCKVYSISVYQNGYVLYQGDKNVDKIGKYTTQLTKDEIKLFKDAFTKIEFTNYSKSYLDKNKRDLPKITIEFLGKKIIYHKRKAPKKLIELAQFIENKINQMRLTPISNK